MDIIKKISDNRIKKIAEKILSGESITEEDGFFLLSTSEIFDLAIVASHIKEKMHQKKVFYQANINLNYTNICDLRCPLCAFSCDRGDKRAYTYGLDKIKSIVKKAVDDGVEEVHIVGGLNPQLEYDYYREMLKSIKEINPAITIVAFTPTEYDYFSRLYNIPVEKILEDFKKLGLDAMPGGGAEIFAPEVREKIAPGKISGERWLEIHGMAHERGIKTNGTILYNHIEEDRHIIDHLSRIRNQQRETGGFKTFVPLIFHEKNTKIRAKRRATTAMDDVRIYALSRIFLDNIPHIKALWMYTGEKMAQTLLHAGVDDLGGTYYNEKVVHSAGASTKRDGSEEFLKGMIESAGFVPVKTTAVYE